MTQTAVEADTGLPLADLAGKYGLSAAGKLPSLWQYTKELWAYRHFISEFAKARVTASLGETKLGMLWQLLIPLFNAGVYYIVFGLLMATAGGVHNRIGYIVSGVFIFSYMQTVTQAGVTAITGNLGLIRALHFPRAALPIALTIIEARNMVVSIGVLAVIELSIGEHPTARWFLIIPAVLLQTVFNAGLALLMARLGSKLRDLRQLVPFIMRLWMYISAVIFAATQFTTKIHNHLLLHIVLANPALIFVQIARNSMMPTEPTSNPLAKLWIKAAVWAVVIGIGGYTYFWRGEKEYGRG